MRSRNLLHSSDSRGRWALVFGLFLSALLLIPSSAFAQYIRYEATGHLKQFNDVIDAGTTADLAALGIVPGAAGVGTPVTAYALVDAAEADLDPGDTTVGTYPAIFIRIDVGDGIIVANEFQRDANVNVALGADVCDIPFALDLFGWTGSEPLGAIMPGAFLFDSQTAIPPSAPCAGDGRDGKGHAAGLVALTPSAALPDDSLPAALSLGDFIAAPIYLDLLDTSRQTVPGTIDKIQLEFEITSLTVTNEPSPTAVPATGPMGLVLLISAMLATGALAVAAQRKLRA